MPTYLYCCDKCGYEFTKVLAVKDRNVPEGECPICALDSVRKVIGNYGGFRLGTKGKVSWASGGYSTTLGDAREAESK